ncbi:MAG: HD domain-containing protein [bacterium]
MSNTTSILGLLDALQFAAEKHSRQRRKDADASPYINHPIAVAASLARCGVSDLVTLQAAILHDTIEDTKTTPPELEGRFGKDVTAIVQELTDDKQLPKEKRKQRQIEHAPLISAKAKSIKIADKISNVHDIIYTPPRFWSRREKKKYLEFTEQVVKGCRGVNKELENEFDKYLEEAGKSLK